jgi:hypothetical protein
MKRRENGPSIGVENVVSFAKYSLGVPIFKIVFF